MTHEISREMFREEAQATLLNDLIQGIPRRTLQKAVIEQGFWSFTVHRKHWEWFLKPRFRPRGSGVRSVTLHFFLKSPPATDTWMLLMLWSWVGRSLIILEFLKSVFWGHVIGSSKHICWRSLMLGKSINKVFWVHCHVSEMRRCWEISCRTAVHVNISCGLRRWKRLSWGNWG